MKKIGLPLLFVILLCVVTAQPAQAGESHGLSLYGDLKYPSGFTHFDYVNPDAPKGGTLRLAQRGTFDSLNPYILKGISAPGIDLTFETLMTQSNDEPFSQYGLLAQSVELAPDRTSIVFNLRPEARFHDGKPVTADDVVFTFTTLMAQGHPFYRAYYADVKEVKAEGLRRVRFTFKHGGNRELPLIVGQMPVLPKHVLEGKDFSATTLSPIVGSGPYRVEEVKPPRKIVYARVKDWWGRNLPVNRGRYNFDHISYDLYLDQSVLMQALLAGSYDVREENIAKAWTDDYVHPSIDRGDIVKKEIPHEIPAGMQAFVYNTRRPIFSDPRVREALNYAFDFEWSNKNFASSSYKRTQSFFANSDLASAGLPKGEERAVLEDLARRYPGSVPARAFSDVYTNPQTDATPGGVRANLLKAKELLSQAGWGLDSKRRLSKDDKPFEFEILLVQPEFQRWVLPFVGNLRKLGVTARVRVVDPAQYQNRMDSFDFDMSVGSFAQGLSPGNEQRDYWHSKKADERGSRNLAGIKNPAVDALVARIIAASSRAELQVATRALDRVLLWNFYVIPQWHIDYHRVAYWNIFGRPEHPAKYGLGVVDTWWIDRAKAAALSPRKHADSGEEK